MLDISSSEESETKNYSKLKRNIKEIIIKTIRRRTKEGNDFSSSEESETKNYSKLKRNIKEIIIKTITRKIEERNVKNPVVGKKKNSVVGELLQQFIDFKEFKKPLADSSLSKTDSVSSRSTIYTKKKIPSLASASFFTSIRASPVRALTRNHKYVKETENYEDMAIEETGGSQSSKTQDIPSRLESRENSNSSLGSQNHIDELSEHSKTSSSYKYHRKEIRNKGKKVLLNRKNSSEAEQTFEVTDGEQENLTRRELVVSTKASYEDTEASESSITNFWKVNSTNNSASSSDNEISLKKYKITKTESPTITHKGKEETECEKVNKNATILNVTTPALKASDPLTLNCDTSNENPFDLSNIYEEIESDFKERPESITSLESALVATSDDFMKADRSEDLKKMFPSNQCDDELIRQTAQELQDMDQRESMRAEECRCTQIPCTFSEMTEAFSGVDGDMGERCCDNSLLLERIDRLQEQITELRQQMEVHRQHYEREARDLAYVSDLIKGFNRPPAIRTGIQWDDWELKEMVRERMREKKEAAALEYQTRLRAVDALCSAELGRLEQALDALMPLEAKASSWGSAVDLPPSLRSSWMAQDYFLEVTASMNLSTSDQKTLTKANAISTNGDLSSSVEPKPEDQ